MDIPETHKVAVLVVSVPLPIILHAQYSANSKQLSGMTRLIISRPRQYQSRKFRLLTCWSVCR